MPRPPEHSPENPACDRPRHHARRGPRASQRGALPLWLVRPLDDPLVRAATAEAVPEPDTARAGAPAAGPGRRAPGVPVPPRRADPARPAGRWARPGARHRGLAREPLLPDAPGRLLRVLACARPPASVAGPSGPPPPPRPPGTHARPRRAGRPARGG